MKRRGWLTVAAVVAGLLLYLPLFVVIAGSFNSGRSGAWEGFTGKWYTALWNNHDAQRAFANTLRLGGMSTAISTLLGTLLGYVLARHTFRGRRVVERALQLPVFVPDIVLAVGLVLLFQFTRSWLGMFELGMPAMVAGHVAFQIPIVALVVRARLEGMEPALEEAAHDLGADAAAVFRHVTWPLMWPGVLAGALLAFTLSVDDFVVSYFTGGPGSTTLPVLIYTSVKRGVSPEINALCTVLIVVSVLATMGRWRMARR